MLRLFRTLTFFDLFHPSLRITFPLRRNLTVRFLAGVCHVEETDTLPRVFSTSPNPITATASASSGRYRALKEMNTSSPHPPESDAAAATAGEDFVHVDNSSPKSNLESLVQSIASVDEESDDISTIPDEGAVGSNAKRMAESDLSVEADRGADTPLAADVEGGRRRVLPEDISRNVVTLSCESSADGGYCDVYMVGTAHVSMESCREVEAVVSFLKPQVVFLELCSNRVAVLTPQNLKIPTTREMVDMWKKKHNIFGILYSWFLAKVASKLEVFPGSEFRVAFDEAMKYGGKVVLGDRPVQITLRRTWAKMPLWHKTKLLYSMIFQAFFLPSPEDLNRMLKEMDDVDMLTLVIQEISKEFPTLMETLVHERDQYMSSTLLKVASEHSSVVAVVGKGHLNGIKKHWKQPVEVKDLLDMPSQKPAISMVKALGTLGMVVAGVAIISGIYISTKK